MYPTIVQSITLTRKKAIFRKIREIREYRKVCRSVGRRAAHDSHSMITRFGVWLHADGGWSWWAAIPSFSIDIDGLARENTIEP